MASMTLQSFNPWTRALIWQGHCAAAAEVDQAVQGSVKAMETWQELTIDDRWQVLERIRDSLAQHQEQIADLITAETGKPLWEATTEAKALVAKFAVTRAAYDQRAEDRAMLDGAATWRHAPHGLCAVLGPFNLPAHLANGQILPALLAGNGVVFKPSEKTPAVGALLAEIFQHELPTGLLGLVQGDRDTGAALVDHPAVNAIFFTGSRRGGSAIHRQLAGRPEVLLALEMGGNNPLIVWDADPAVAARGICDSAFVTTGQRCVCARRLVIPADERGDAIIDALMARIDHLRIGDPRSDPPVFMGTMIDPAAVRTVENQTKDWLGRGAQVIRPFTAMDIGHALVQPGVYDCTGADCGDEEWFAPVLQVIRCKDFNSAIDRANHTAYGLAAGLVDPDIGHWRQFRQQVRAGILYRNRHITGASGQLPFGGWGHSGNHRPAGVTMIDHCLQAQACMHLDDPLPASAFPGCTGDAS